MADSGRMRINRRGIKERIFDSDHLTLGDLRRNGINHGYLYNNIPPYPRPELHVTHLSHSTDLSGLEGVHKSKGFRGPYNDDELNVAWFSLTVSRSDLRDAETRHIYIVHRHREELVRPWQNVSLKKFSSSPAFSSRSRYGSYRFTFSLKDVLDKYSQQFCAGVKPVMKIWKTVLYKQEVMYAVLVHPPTNQRFSRFPLLQRSSVCEFREDPQPQFIWRPQAMCNFHRFQMYPDGSWGDVPPDNFHRFYVWDHVAIALDVGDQVFRFNDMELKKSLRYCKKERPSNERFEYFYDAQEAVNALWPKGTQRLDSFAKSVFAVSR